MVNYVCFRCGHSTNNRSYMKLHINRKKMCKPHILDINVIDFSAEILNHTNPFVTDFNPKKLHLTIPENKKAPKSLILTISCDFCGKTYSRKQYLTRHLQKCVEKQICDDNNSSMHELVQLLHP